MTKFVCLLNPGAENLDVILGIENTSKKMKGIGYTSESSNPNIVFVSPIRKHKSRCHIRRHNYLPKFITSTLMILSYPLGDVITMVDVVTFNLTSINCMLNNSISNNYILNGLWILIYTLNNSGMSSLDLWIIFLAPPLEYHLMKTSNGTSNHIPTTMLLLEMALKEKYWKMEVRLSCSSFI